MRKRQDEWELLPLYKYYQNGEFVDKIEKKTTGRQNIYKNIRGETIQAYGCIWFFEKQNTPVGANRKRYNKYRNGNENKDRQL